MLTLANVKVTIDLRNIPYTMEDENISAIVFGTATGGSNLFVKKEDYESAVKTLLSTNITTEVQAIDALNL